jgi:hypothetical protein
MFPLYLFSLIVGGGLLLFSLLGLGGDGVDADAAPEAHFDGASLAQEFLSVRALCYLLAGFGATGVLLELFTDAGGAATLAWSLATGMVAAMAAGTLYAWARRTESGLVPMDHDYLVGLPARVILPVEGERRGKVLAVHGGRQVELLARLHSTEDAACPRDAEVVIVDVDGDTALVVPMPAFPPILSEE